MKQRLSEIPFLKLAQRWVELKVLGWHAHLNILVENPAHLAPKFF
jgi:hypothetical protein